MELLNTLSQIRVGQAHNEFQNELNLASNTRAGKQLWPRLLARMLCLGALLLHLQANAQTTTLKAGDIVIMGVQCTDPDDFTFAPLIDLAGGTQIVFTDNGWLASGGFRATEGTATYTVPQGGIAKGTLIGLQANSANFVTTSQFELTTKGDQLIAYQGNPNSPVFICAYTKTGWSDATTSSTSALPTGLRNGVTAVATSWINTYMYQTALRRGAPGQLRPWFGTAANWTGSNSLINRGSWPPTNLIVETAQASAVAGNEAVNSAQNRVQEIVLTESNFAAYQLGGTLSLIDNSPTACTNSSINSATKSAKLLLRLDTGPVHNVGDAANPFTTTFDIAVTGCLANGQTCAVPLLNTLSTNGPIRITTATSPQTPRQTYVLDLGPALQANPSLSQLNVQISSLVVSPTTMRQHMRLVARLEQELRVTPPQPGVTTTLVSVPYDNFETNFAWTSTCNLVKNYQVQILKLTEGTTALPTQAEQAWQRDATLLETGNGATTLTTSLAAGAGTYAWRVRGIGTQYDGGIANPQNWGDWSEVGFKTLNPPASGNSWITNLNWIYTRNFSEGGREKEQLTFANGLLHTRQSLTKLHLAGGPQIIGSQTLQDYVGRDALETLPFPLPTASGTSPVPANAFLGFRAKLFTTDGTTVYGPAHFDADGTPATAGTSATPGTLSVPSQAVGLGNYYSGTAQTVSSNPDNTGVAGAESYPFTRTLFTRDGTNRVREQAGAGGTLGLVTASGVKHTIRTSYGSVAQDELTQLFGVDEAPLAANTYKIVTQDANNSAAVTYQTKAGQTIATALIANSGNPNVESLGSAPQSGTNLDIVDHVNERIADGSTGSISSKMLVVPPGGITLNMTYSISPNEVRDLCNHCSTCDYRVEITVRSMDDPSQTTVIPPFKADLTACGQPAGNLAPISPVTISEAGTYLIEKRLIAYTSPTVANSSNVPTFLDSKLTEFLSEYEALKNGTTAIQPGAITWASIQQALSASNTSKTKVSDLYSQLDNLNYPTRTIDGVLNYVLPFGCDNGEIYLPKLDTNCGPVTTCSAQDKTGFEAYLLANINIPGHASTYAYTYFPDLGQPGDIDKMIGAMLNDPAYSTQCDKAWSCWRGLIEGFNQTADSQQNTGNVPAGAAKPNLQTQFLQCFGAVFTGTSTSAPIPEQVYNTFYFDDQDPKHHNCKESVLTAAHLASGSSISALIQQQALDQRNHPDEADEYDYLQMIYSCIQSNSPLPANVNPQDLTQQQVDEVHESGVQQCENRRLEFKKAILADFRRKGIYTYQDQNVLVLNDELHTYIPGAQAHAFSSADDVGECEVDLMVEELVLSCKKYTDITPAYDATTGKLQFTQDQIDHLKAAMLYKPEVQVHKVGEKCDDPITEPKNVPFEPAVYLPGPQLQTVSITSCGEKVISYLNELVHTANNFLPHSAPYNIMGCPATGIGVGEAQKDVLSYVGPLEVGCNRMFSDYSTYGPNNQGNPVRTNYWVTIQDGRADSGLPNVNNPDHFSNAKYNFQTDFRLIWGHNSFHAPSNFPYVCYANGSDVPGVPKLLNFAGGNETFDYIVNFIDSNNNVILKSDILNVGVPFADAGVIGSTDLYSSAGVRVRLRLKNGTSKLAGIQVLPANLNYIPSAFSGTQAKADEYLSKFLMWKNVETCEIPNRRYTTCFRFVDPVVVLTDNDNIYNPIIPDCQTVLAATLAQSIQQQQNTWIQAKLANFRQNYAAKCVDPGTLHDDLTIRYRLGNHHFTLYYYDRAGNLIKTVPPAGVVRVDPTTNDVPGHKLVTSYQYNSFKQLVRQTTPDGGTTDFVYNRIGQLRFSINDKQAQATPKLYSYTKYDELGRPIETGETSFQAPTVADPSKTLRQTILDRFAAVEAENASFPSSSTNRVQTRTVFDTPYRSSTTSNSGITCNGQAPRYLTNRVAYAEAFNNPNSTVADVRTHYSYDPHGNVEWMAQELMPGLGLRFTRYEYDLISNKVLLVAYQEGQADQFFHRYEYDDENRLLAVSTSADGVDWDQDAKYSYYLHGPLKRTVLGQDQVQGLDYTYTLQGWLKSINQPDLTQNNDPGRDAATSNPSGAGTDAFGMVLNYYQGDYKRAGIFPDASQTNSPIFQPTVTSSNGNVTDHNLYNGNIATWQSNNRQDVPNKDPQLADIATPVNEQYRYDQLNRILNSHQYTLGSSTPAEQTAYATEYTYDASGNLLTLKRNGDTGTGLFDDLEYKYLEKTSTTGNLLSNQLSYVKDNAGANTLSDDVEDQTQFYTPATGTAPAAYNYTYDALGNLTQDAQSGVTAIEWTLAGKIRSIRKDNPAYPGDVTRATIISYRYDAAGNRVSKDVSTSNGYNRQHTYYVRDTQGNIMAVYDQREEDDGLLEIILREQPIYGSHRIGERKPNLTLPYLQPVATPYATRTIGLKYYEVIDHLGNVRAVVTDQKSSTLASGTLLVQPSGFRPTLSAYYNYYPFGMMKPGQYGPGTGTANGGYRFGYNGKEKDNNLELGLTNYDYGFRIYNPGIAKFLSVDPLTKSYPMLTPYQFASNRPIDGVDKDGLEWEAAVIELSIWYTKLKNGTDDLVSAGLNRGSYNNPNVPKPVQNVQRLGQAARGAEAVTDAGVAALENVAETVGSLPVVEIVADPLFVVYYTRKGDYVAAAAYASSAAIPIVSGGIVKKVVKTAELLRWEVKTGEESANKIFKLVEKMKKEGFSNLPPIEVYVHDGVTYLVDGHHRLAAAKVLGFENVPVKYLTEQEFKAAAKKMERFSTPEQLKAIAERPSVKNGVDVAPREPE